MFKFKPQNWSAYNKAKIQQGNIFIYFSPDIQKQWYAKNKNVKRGHNQVYSNWCIELMLIFRYVLKLPLRQSQGFIMGLLKQLNLNLAIPDYTTISRRSKSLSIEFRESQPIEDLYIIVDATGVGIYHASEWHADKYNKKVKRKWRKMSIAINAHTGEVIANTLSNSDDADSSQVKDLLVQLPDHIEAFLADGGYDKHQTFNALSDYQSRTVDVIIPPIKTLGIPEDPKIELSQRQQHRYYLDHYGKDRWRNKTNYGVRERVEAFFARFKSMFGERLLSQEDCVQNTEMNIKCKLLNKFNNLYDNGYQKVRI